MVDGRRKEAWDRTAQVCWWLREVNRNPRTSSSISPIKLNPWRRQEAAAIERASVVQIDPKQFVEELGKMLGAVPAKGA